MNAEYLSFVRLRGLARAANWLWACVNCGTVIAAEDERDLVNCRVCALIAQMSMAMPRG